MITRLLSFMLVLVSLTIVASPAALAFDPFGGGDCNASDQGSAVCTSKTTTDPISGPNGIILKAATIIAVIAGAAAIITILVGAVRMITSNGDSNGFAKARSTVIYALIGLVVIIAARAIIGFFVSKL